MNKKQLKNIKMDTSKMEKIHESDISVIIFKNDKSLVKSLGQRDTRGLKDGAVNCISRKTSVSIHSLECIIYPKNLAIALGFQIFPNQFGSVKALQNFS